MKATFHPTCSNFSIQMLMMMQHIIPKKKRLCAFMFVEAEKLIQFLSIFRLVEEGFHQAADLQHQADRRCRLRAGNSIGCAGNLRRNFASVELWPVRHRHEGQKVCHGAEHPYGSHEANVGSSATAVGKSEDSSSAATGFGTHVQVRKSYETGKVTFFTRGSTWLKLSYCEKRFAMSELKHQWLIVAKHAS